MLLAFSSVERVSEEPDELRLFCCPEVGPIDGLGSRSIVVYGVFGLPGAGGSGNVTVQVELIESFV
jgi:hypothetical protein